MSGVTNLPRPTQSQRTWAKWLMRSYMWLGLIGTIGGVVGNGQVESHNGNPWLWVAPFLVLILIAVACFIASRRLRFRIEGMDERVGADLKRRFYERLLEQPGVSVMRFPLPQVFGEFVVYRVQTEGDAQFMTVTTDEGRLTVHTTGTASAELAEQVAGEVLRDEKPPYGFTVVQHLPEPSQVAA
ncbi:MAG TPA: hypothetical protein VLF67_03770 [Candidatus Saccharimonas sp.]|nr:hypothetical protein [Candidatus Saccharimonas sp.]